MDSNQFRWLSEDEKEEHPKKDPVAEQKKKKKKKNKHKHKKKHEAKENDSVVRSTPDAKEDNQFKLQKNDTKNEVENEQNDPGFVTVTKKKKNKNAFNKNGCLPVVYYSNMSWQDMPLDL